MQDFRGVKVGDRVWSIELGDCEVWNITEDSIWPIGCKNSKGRKKTYCFDGRLDSAHFTASLFWSNPNIIAPEKPKKIVTYTIDCPVSRIHDSIMIQVAPIKYAHIFTAHNVKLSYDVME